MKKNVFLVLASLCVWWGYPGHEGPELRGEEVEQAGHQHTG